MIIYVPIFKDLDEEAAFWDSHSLLEIHEQGDIVFREIDAVLDGNFMKELDPNGLYPNMSLILIKALKRKKDVKFTEEKDVKVIGETPVRIIRKYSDDSVRRSFEALYGDEDDEAKPYENTGRPKGLKDGHGRTAEYCDEIRCVVCDKRFFGVHRKKYCSKKCYKESVRVANREEYIKKPQIKTSCLWCGNSFSTSKSKQRFCSKQCRIDYHNIMKAIKVK